jgi:hypothetical protein
MDLEYDALEETGAPKIGDNALKSVAHLGEKLRDVERAIAHLESLLATAKADRHNLRTELIPQAMDAVGLSEFRLADGTKISVESSYDASLRKDFETEAVTWLKDHGHGGIVKAAVTALLPRGKGEKAEQIARLIAEQSGVRAEVRETVHPMTMKKFYRELVEEGGGELPEQLFSVWHGRLARIK